MMSEGDARHIYKVAPPPRMPLLYPSTYDPEFSQGGEAEPSEGCSYLTRVAPVVIKNDLTVK